MGEATLASLQEQHEDTPVSPPADEEEEETEEEAGEEGRETADESDKEDKATSVSASSAGDSHAAEAARTDDRSVRSGSVHEADAELMAALHTLQARLEARLVRRRAGATGPVATGFFQRRCVAWASLTPITHRDCTGVLSAASGTAGCKPRQGRHCSIGCRRGGGEPCVEEATAAPNQYLDLRLSRVGMRLCRSVELTRAQHLHATAGRQAETDDIGTRHVVRTPPLRCLVFFGRDRVLTGFSPPIDLHLP